MGKIRAVQDVPTHVLLSLHALPVAHESKAKLRL